MAWRRRYSRRRASVSSPVSAASLPPLIISEPFAEYASRIADGSEPCHPSLETLGSWGGNASDCRKEAQHGAPSSVVERALALIERLDGISIETLERVREPSVAGGSVSVGAYLSGNPLCFRRSVRKASDYAPVRIVYNRAASAGTDSGSLESIGVTILALALKLQSVRPVEIVISWNSRLPGENRDCFFFFPLGISPLDVSACAFAFFNVSLLRSFFFSRYLSLKGHQTGIPFASGSVRDAMPLAGLIPSSSDLITSDIRAGEILSDPEGWIRVQIERMTED